MKKVILLRGRENTGKTYTLNYLIGLLDKTKEVYDDALKEDRCLVISYNGMKIAIGTKGDGEREVKENIKFAVDNGCDILVTATRSKGQTVKAVEDYSRVSGVTKIWIKKNLAMRLTESVNEVQAEDIQSLINTL